MSDDLNPRPRYDIGITDEDLRAYFEGEDELLEFWEVESAAASPVKSADGVWRPLGGDSENERDEPGDREALAPVEEGAPVSEGVGGVARARRAPARP